jgi:hypothetical protein
MLLQVMQYNMISLYNDKSFYGRLMTDGSFRFTLEDRCVVDWRRMQSLKDRHQLDEIAIGEGEILRVRAMSREVFDAEDQDQFPSGQMGPSNRET